MREIKFKGVTFYDEVVFSHSICSPRDEGNLEVDFMLKHEGLWRIIKRGTLSQYTGHKDIEDVEIYNGDKIQSNSGAVLEVRETANGWQPFKLDSGRACGWEIACMGKVLK